MWDGRVFVTDMTMLVGFCDKYPRQSGKIFGSESDDENGTIEMNHEEGLIPNLD